MGRGTSIIVFDIGKTNKKVFLLDEHYQILVEDAIQFAEISDEDGFPCDDVARLSQWVIDSFGRLVSQSGPVTAVNISAYGASLVHVDTVGNVLTPLYNYLKPFPPELGEKFYRALGDERLFSLQTASPALGNLNSGLQLYRLKYINPELFSQVKYSLHLPQYLSWLLARQASSEMTSIGCHTAMWDFGRKDYHSWIYTEGLDKKLAPIVPAEQASVVKGVQVGTGLHDSSAALIPYLVQFKEPFVLLSTGTWCISLNPFSTKPLTMDELQHDCLCYLDIKGNPVKAARLFAGHEHKEQTKRMAADFHADPAKYRAVVFRPELIRKSTSHADQSGSEVQLSGFTSRDWLIYDTYEEAYHRLILDIIQAQKRSTNRIMEDNVQTIFVDGGFSANVVFMNLLAAAFPNKKVFGATIHQAAAVGAAVVIHQHWNHLPVPAKSIQLKAYTADPSITF